MRRISASVSSGVATPPSKSAKSRSFAPAESSYEPFSARSRIMRAVSAHARSTSPSSPPERSHRRRSTFDDLRMSIDGELVTVNLSPGS